MFKKLFLQVCTFTISGYHRLLFKDLSTLDLQKRTAKNKGLCQEIFKRTWHETRENKENQVFCGNAPI